MRANSVLVYASETTANELNRRIAQESRSGWEKEIKIKATLKTKPALRGSSSKHYDLDSVEREISREWQQGNIARVFVERDLKLKTLALEREGVKLRDCSRASMLHEILDELKRRRLHWLDHSVHEWNKSGICHLHPQAWREQFATLGHDWIGEGILKQLRVISDAELRKALVVPEPDLLGLSVAHACVLDNEAGSSSVNVRDLLEHTYPCDVLALDFKTQPDGLESVDHLYVYEDGLWSGVELVKRLAMIANWPRIKSRELKVTFRFAATSEAGLYAARHFLKREKLTSVDVMVGKLLHFTHLNTRGNARDLLTRAITDDEVRKTIDGLVEPMAFRDQDVWLGRAPEAMEICKEIGEQLVRPWITRTKGPTEVDQRAPKWALGAFSFASVTSFSKSVPKPVLPLIWLNGEVELNGSKVQWRPLFWDSRRTGTQPPAH